MTGVVVIEAVAIVLLGLLVAGLLRSHAEILRRLHALGAGMEGLTTDETGLRLAAGVSLPRQSAQPAFDIAGESPSGEAVGISIIGAPQSTLLAFLSSGCLTCEGFWAEFRKPQGLGLPAGIRLVIVTKGPGEESLSRIQASAPGHVPVVMSTSAWNDYGVPGSPYFILVSEQRGLVVGEGSASTWSEVKGLIEQALADALAMSDSSTRARSGSAGRDRVDTELMAAGIGPGHPSLYGGAPSLRDHMTSPEAE